MPMELDVVIEDPRWTALEIEALAARACAATLDHFGLDAAEAEVTLLACDDARIAALNADFRGKSAPTNVLSWPAEDRAPDTPGAVPPAPRPGLDGMIGLGDIAIAFDTCRREAEEAGKPIDAHVTHLLVHGMLHLLGYDHDTDPDADLMEGLEVKILGKLGLDDPYRTGAGADPRG